MTHRKTGVALLTALAILGTGCGAGAGESWPDDEPANHGRTAIMETEGGYYYNFGENYYAPSDYGSTVVFYTSAQRMRYYDKESGEAILLCTRPECLHKSDENCVATYKGIGAFNTVLYNGALYTYAVEAEDTVIRLALYRTAADGSAIDRIATILEVENTADAQYTLFPQTSPANGFIIHRGYAYVPYYLKIGKASSGFQGGGLKRVDLRTGEVVSLQEMETPIDPYPHRLFGAGDYVYASFNSGSYKTLGPFRYKIPDENDDGTTPEAAVPGWEWVDIDFATEDYLFYKSFSFDDATGEIKGRAILVFDIDGNQLVDKTFEFEYVERVNTLHQSDDLMVYEDILFYFDEDVIRMFSIKEEDWGTPLGEIPFDPELDSESYYNWGKDFHICNGKIYRVIMDENYILMAENHLAENQAFSVVYCGIEDALDGKTEWKKAFSYLPGE